MKQREPVQLDIKVQVIAEGMQKLWLWTDIAKGEFSALGMVDEIKDQDTGAVTALRITQFYLVKQQCSDADCELDPSGVSELMMDLEAQGLPSCKLRCWVHSHADMDVFHLLHLYINDVVWEVHYPAIEGLAEQCQKEFKEKVKEGFGLTNIIKSHHQPVTSRLGILPDELDEDLYWEGVDLDDIEELEVR